MNENISKWLVSWPATLSESMARERIDQCLQDMKMGSAIHLVLLEKRTADLAGWTSLWMTESPGRWRIGFWVVQPFQSRGFAPEAIEATIEAARRVARLRVVEATLQSENRRSASVLRRLGFRHAGWASEPSDVLLFEKRLDEAR